MDVFTFAFLCVLIGCSIPLSKIWLNRKRSVEQHEISHLEAEIDALRTRIATLEKIVTDDKYQLAKELEQLENAG